MDSKIIKIGEKDVGFKINSAILYLYKETFGEEYLVDVDKVHKTHTEEELNRCLQTLYRLEWCMAYLYDKSIPPIMTWLEQFPIGVYKVDEVWKELLPIIKDDIKVDRKND